MAREVAAVIGSGTLPWTREILTSGQRGVHPTGGGIRVGTQVVVANPEDLTSVDVFRCSGVSVGATSVEILGPGKNPLPRMREVIVSNGGSSAVLLSHQQNFTDVEGYPLAADGTFGDTVKIPVLWNASVWARCASGSTTVKLIIY